MSPAPDLTSGLAAATPFSFYNKTSGDFRTLSPVFAFLPIIQKMKLIIRSLDLPKLNLISKITDKPRRRRSW